MQGNGGLGLITLGEVIALEDTGNSELGAHLQQAGQVHRQNPVAVVHDGGLLGIEDLHCLRDVGLGVGLDLLL